MNSSCILYGYLCSLTNCLYVRTCPQVDQALVSLVDKEKMRAKQANILEILKVWLKASAAERAAQATEGAMRLATAALGDNEVSCITSTLSLQCTACSVRTRNNILELLLLLLVLCLK